MGRQKVLLYVIGPPGVGKSTIVNLALGRPLAGSDTPMKHEIYKGGIQLGRLRKDFPGSDTLPFNVQPRVVEWLKSGAPARIVVEGDRLANGKFFEDVQAAGYRLSVVYFEASENTLILRRNARGSMQNPVWIKGRTTKGRKLAEKYGALAFSTEGDPAECALRLQALPEIQAMRRR